MSKCVLWAYGKFTSGYGSIRREGKSWRAHRWVWTQHRGAIPKGMHVLHECDTPACMNLNHLYLGSHQQNMKDRTDRNRGARFIGEDHPSAKLTTNQVLQIRADNRSYQAISEDYPVGKSTVKAIKSRRLWKHL